MTLKLPSLALGPWTFLPLATLLTLAACGGTVAGAGDAPETDSGPGTSADDAAAIDATVDSPPPTDANRDASQSLDVAADGPSLDATDAATPDSTAPDASTEDSPDATDGSPDATDASMLDAPSDSSPGADASDAAVTCDDGGPLDTTFGTCGIFSTSALPALLGTSDAWVLVRGMVVQKTGTIVLAGIFASGFPSPGTIAGALPWVARVRADGKGIDSSFASGGVLALPSLPRSGPYDGVTLVQQSDGKLLVGASCPTNVPGKVLPDICLTRLSADGALDSSYGAAGVAHVSLSSADDESLGRCALDPQGRALLAGVTETSSTDTAYLVRLTAAGVPDPTFNAGAPLDVAQASATNGVALGDIVTLSSGRIFFLAGPALQNVSLPLAALTSSGAPDDTIDPGADAGLANVVSLPTAFHPVALLVAPDDSAYALGGTYPGAAPSAPAVVKITPAGAVDETFGSAGEAVFPSEPGSDFEAAVLEGSSVYTNGWDLWIDKIGLDGALDPGWGAGGSVASNWGPAETYVSWLLAVTARGPLVPGAKDQTVYLAQLHR
jgi:uncharacterized delta-60 repeat protein